MNHQDALVAKAVERRLPAITAAMAAAERMARGGRLVYAGAGTAGRLGVLDSSECPPTFGVDPGLVVGLIAGGRTAVTEAESGPGISSSSTMRKSSRTASATGRPGSESSSD